MVSPSFRARKSKERRDNRCSQRSGLGRSLSGERSLGRASNIGFRSTPNLQTLRQDGTAIRAKATAASNASWATPEGSTCQLSSQVTRSARVERRRRPALPCGWRSSGPRNRARGDGTCRSRASARCLLSLRKRHETKASSGSNLGRKRAAVLFVGRRKGRTQRGIERCSDRSFSMEGIPALGIGRRIDVRGSKDRGFACDI